MISCFRYESLDLLYTFVILINKIVWKDQPVAPESPSMIPEGSFHQHHVIKFVLIFYATGIKNLINEVSDDFLCIFTVN